MAADLEISFDSNNDKDFLEHTLNTLLAEDVISFWVYTENEDLLHGYVSPRDSTGKTFSFDAFECRFDQDGNKGISSIQKEEFKKWYKRTALAKGMGMLTNPNFHSHKGFVSSAPEWLDQLVFLEVGDKGIPAFPGKKKKPDLYEWVIYQEKMNKKS